MNFERTVTESFPGRTNITTSGLELRLVTDSQMGIEYIQSELGLAAANAVNRSEKLAGIIKKRLSTWSM